MAQAQARALLMAAGSHSPEACLQDAQSCTHSVDDHAFLKALGLQRALKKVSHGLIRVLKKGCCNLKRSVRDPLPAPLDASDRHTPRKKKWLLGLWTSSAEYT